MEFFLWTIVSLFSISLFILWKYKKLFSLVFADFSLWLTLSSRRQLYLWEIVKWKWDNILIIFWHVIRYSQEKMKEKNENIFTISQSALWNQCIKLDTDKYKTYKKRVKQFNVKAESSLGISWGFLRLDACIHRAFIKKSVTSHSQRPNQTRPDKTRLDQTRPD